MIAGHNDDPFVADAVEQLVREAPQQVATRVSPMQRVREGSCSHCVFRCLQSPQKLGAQAHPLPLVPCKGLLYVGRRLGPVDELLHDERLRIRSRSSSGETPTGPSRSSASRRRSSSASCSSVSGRGSPSTLRLSHSSSRSSSRSSLVSFARSSAGFATAGLCHTVTRRPTATRSGAWNRCQCPCGTTIIIPAVILKDYMADTALASASVVSLSRPRNTGRPASSASMSTALIISFSSCSLRCWFSTATPCPGAAGCRDHRGRSRHLAAAGGSPRSRTLPL
jgi:hypothetical protein